MNLRNYTSDMPVSASILKIKKLLIDMNVRSVIEEYGPDKKIVGITFTIDIHNQTAIFKMPANIEKVFAVLWKEVKNPHRANRANYMDQAERTAWKNISDWVHIQSSLVAMEQAQFTEIFLPYLLNPKTGRTAFELFQENPQKLLG